MYVCMVCDICTWFVSLSLLVGGGYMSSASATYCFCCCYPLYCTLEDLYYCVFSTTNLLPPTYHHLPIMHTHRPTTSSTLQEMLEIESSEEEASKGSSTIRNNIRNVCVILLCLILCIGGGILIAWLLKNGSLLSFGRYDDTSNLQRVLDVNISNLGVFIGYGQSNSDCCGSMGYMLRHTENVFQYGNNATYTYSDPMIGAYCRGGCVYGPIGDRLIDLGRFQSVVFATTGMPGAELSALNHGDEYFEYLVAVYREMNTTFGKVDGVLYHQGESDHGRSSSYFEKFETFLSNLSDEGIDESTGLKMYVSRATYCGNSVDTELNSVQQNLATQLTVVFPGPNTDLLQGSAYRYDDCHFSVLGLERISEMWGGIL
jgi:hypothetical protein